MSTVPSAPRREWQALMRAAAMVGPRRGRLALSILLGAGAILAAVALLAVAGVLISKASLSPPILTLTVFTVAVRGLAMARALLRYFERLVSHDLAFRVLSELRVKFFERLIPLVPEGIRRMRSGEVLNRFTAEVDTLQDLYLRALGPPLIALVVVAVIGVAMAIVLPAGALILVLALVVAGTAIPALALAMTRRSGRRQAPARAALAAELVEVIQGAPELAVYGRQARWLERVQAADDRLMATQRRDALAAALSAVLSVLLSGAALVGVTAVGVEAVSAGRLDGILLAAAVFLTMGAFEAVAGLPDAAQKIAACASAASRLEAVTDEPVPVTGPADPRSLAGGGALVAEAVGFRYPGSGEVALEDVSLELAPGGRVALVGASGSGKTTLARLLVRFADPDSGSIRLGATGLREAAQDDVRHRVRLVGQDAYLFTATIAANVRLARPACREDEIAAALTRAGLGPWLESLPEGIETQVGEEGAAVSGGQRGRIALARGFISDSDHLVLDEPTAQLDPEGARRLLAGLAADRTDPRGILVITHTVEGLEDFDEILVMDGGRIVERGRWTELVSAGGAFATIAAAG
ncbi:MAG: thiol reductant ABC exporter subunit CydC [Solirubrobacterales bacterium]